MLKGKAGPYHTNGTQGLAGQNAKFSPFPHAQNAAVLVFACSFHGPLQKQHPNENEINSQESFRAKVIRLTGIEARVERGLPGRW